MANPQVENGAIQIAHDLYLAVLRADLTGLETRIVLAVAYMTYGAGKTKAEIGLEDIRLVIDGKKVRPIRVIEALNHLIQMNVLFKQEMVNGKFILGVQKDYDKWSAYKMSPSLQDYSTSYYISPSIAGDKKYAWTALLQHAMKRSKFRHSVSTYRKELSVAKALYERSLLATRDPKATIWLLKDFIDTQDQWFFDNVKMQFTYLNSRYEAWAAQIPRKPREVREDEEALGRRYRYNVKTKQWEPAL